MKYKAHVTKVTVFETDEGIGKRAVTPVRENWQAAVDSNDALSRSRKALLEEVARLSRATRIKTSSTLWKRTRRRGRSGSAKVELRCRSVTGGGGKATKPKT